MFSTREIYSMLSLSFFPDQVDQAGIEEAELATSTPSRAPEVEEHSPGGSCADQRLWMTIFCIQLDFNLVTCMFLHVTRDVTIEVIS